MLELSEEGLEFLLWPPHRAAGPSRPHSGRDTRDVLGAVLARHVAAAWGTHAPSTDACPTQARCVASVSAAVSDVHRTYQAARYREAASLLPMVTDLVATLQHEGPPSSARDALRLQASACIVTAKLALKAGDTLTGLTAAERARASARDAEDPFAAAGAVSQMACALLRTENAQDQHTAETLTEQVPGTVRGTDPASLTWRGTLTLTSAIIAARRGDATEAHYRLDHAERLAEQLNLDGNIGWTAFGPTNVLIHRVSAAVALGDPVTALATAEHIDTTAMPQGLSGRRAHLHLASAWAHSQHGDNPLAVIHLLDTERIAPDLIRSRNAHDLISTLQDSARRPVPGLRGLAARAGVAV